LIRLPVSSLQPILMTPPSLTFANIERLTLPPKSPMPFRCPL
jgi:hypothetical protein